MNALSGCTTAGCISGGANVVGACDTNLFHSCNFPNVPVFSSKLQTKQIPHADLIVSMIQNNQMCSLIPWICLGLKPRQIILATRARKWPDWFRGMHLWNWWFETLYAKDFGLPIVSKLKFAVGFRNDVHPTFVSFPFPESPNISRCISSFLDKKTDPSLFVTQKGKIIKKDDLWRLSRGRRVFLKEEKGHRKLSFTELKRIWGLNEDFLVANHETLHKEPHPPLISAVVKEVMDWAWL